MSVNPKVLVETQLLPLATTTMYESAAGIATIIDKAVAYNSSETYRVVITLAVCKDNETPSEGNLLVTRTIQPLENYLFPEITGLVLKPREVVVTGTTPLPEGATTAKLLVFRMTGREVS